jgi:SanA protein
MASAPAAARPRGRLRRRLAWLAGLTVLGLVAGNVLVIATTWSSIVADAAAAPEMSVAIVLGTRVFPRGIVSMDLRGRLASALDLYERQKVTRIFVSGAYHPEEHYDEPEVMAAWLVRHGVPRDAIVLDRGGHRTAATMADAAAAGLHDVLICTQRYHLPRALYLARHAGLQAVGVEADTQARGRLTGAKNLLREGLARPETILEVVVRGVTAR